MVLSGRRASPRLLAAKALVHALALAPLAWLLWQVWREWSGVGSALGADPVAAIEHDLGEWALRFLLATLAVTPLRQLTGQAVLLRFRRMLGLYAFAYATLHLAAYLALDLGAYWTQVWEEIAKRPYITVGFAAWLLLVPLAATSFQAAMRRMGRRWGQLHRAIYAIAVLGVLHLWWIKASKNDWVEPAVYAAILALLLAWRAGKAVAKRGAGRAPVAQRGP